MDLINVSLTDSNMCDDKSFDNILGSSQYIDSAWPEQTWSSSGADLFLPVIMVLSTKLSEWLIVGDKSWAEVVAAGTKPKDDYQGEVRSEVEGSSQVTTEVQGQRRKAKPEPPSVICQGAVWRNRQ